MHIFIVLTMSNMEERDKAKKKHTWFWLRAAQARCSGAVCGETKIYNACKKSFGDCKYRRWYRWK